MRLKAEAEELCWSVVRGEDPKESRLRGACARELIKAHWRDDPKSVFDVVNRFWTPLVRYEATSVTCAWLDLEGAETPAWNFLLDDKIRTGALDAIRGSIVTRRLDLAFKALNLGGLSPHQATYLRQLISDGIGDFQRNPTAAWLAIEKRAAWPACSEADIWLGILKSALRGHTMTREFYWNDFQSWHLEHSDRRCDELLKSIAAR